MCQNIIFDYFFFFKVRIQGPYAVCAVADVCTWVTLKVKCSVCWTFQATVLLKFQIISLANGNLNISVVNGEERSHCTVYLVIENATECEHKFITRCSLIKKKNTPRRIPSPLTSLQKLGLNSQWE